MEPKYLAFRFGDGTPLAHPLTFGDWIPREYYPNIETYCWWFRNPARRSPPFGCKKTLVNNGINNQPQLVTLPGFRTNHQHGLLKVRAFGFGEIRVDFGCFVSLDSHLFWLKVYASWRNLELWKSGSPEKNVSNIWKYRKMCVFTCLVLHHFFCWGVSLLRYAFIVQHPFSGGDLDFFVGVTTQKSNELIPKIAIFKRSRYRLSPGPSFLVSIWLLVDSGV